MLEATAVLGKEYTEVLKGGFENRWIDVYENKGKRGGAYSAGQLVHPYVLLNYKETLDSEFTLAHEMGHAMHSWPVSYTHLIQAFIQYVRNFTQPITQIAQVSNMLQSTAAAAERVFEFLEEEEEVQTVENAVSTEGLTGEVTFDHVQFGYTPEKIIINDFSCKVKPGQTVAIVGPTGAGKTTMVKLLMRFYDVNGGSICLDGHDVRRFNRGQLREMLDVYKRQPDVLCRSLFWSRRTKAPDGQYRYRSLWRGWRLNLWRIPRRSGRRPAGRRS